jgi:predicted RNase H-like HicB family nuclease
VPRQFDRDRARFRGLLHCLSSPDPRCHTQARSLDELTERIREAIALCLEIEGVPEQELEFVGIQRVIVAA